MSGSIKAKVNIGLSVPLILGMPFLSAEHVVIDAHDRTAIDKRTGFDLLNNPVYPPCPITPDRVVPPPTPKKI